MSQIIRKTYQAVETKAVNEETRTLVVKISTSTPDRSDDVVVPKGMVSKNYLTNPVVAFAHNYAGLSIGKTTELQSTDDAIIAKVEFVPKGVYPLADQLFEMYKGGFMNAWSIGFIPKKWVDKEDGGRMFEEWELLEYSAVLVPDNPEALTLLRSKGIDPDKLIKQQEEAATKTDSPTNSDDTEGSDESSASAEDNSLPEETVAPETTPSAEAEKPEEDKETPPADEEKPTEPENTPEKEDETPDLPEDPNIEELGEVDNIEINQETDELTLHLGDKDLTFKLSPNYATTFYKLIAPRVESKSEQIVIDLTMVLREADKLIGTALRDAKRKVGEDLRIVRDDLRVPIVIGEEGVK